MTVSFEVVASQFAEARLKRLLSASPETIPAPIAEDIGYLLAEIERLRATVSGQPEEVPSIATLWPKSQRQLVPNPGKPDSGYGAMLDTHREAFAKTWAYETGGGGNPPPKYAHAYAFLGWWTGREVLKRELGIK